MLEKYKIKLAVKNKSNFMKAAGLIQALFSGIPYKEFMNSYTSTIGSTIYGDAEWIRRIKSGKYDCDDGALLVHEVQHVLQFRNGSWKKYVRSGGRALLEAEAIAAANQFRVGVGDEVHIKDRFDVINQLRLYGCKLKDCIAAANYVEIATQPSEMVLDAIKEYVS